MEDKRQVDRLNTHVALPALEVLDVGDIFKPTQAGLSMLPIDIERLRQHFWKEGRLTLNAVNEIVTQTTQLLADEENVIELNAPLTLFGDIHGQYYDLVHTLKKMDPPQVDDPWLFLGDYVDRGSFKVVLFLFALKICYPKSVYLLRGNHECRHLGSHYSFKKELIAKYKNDELFEAINVAFDNLPLAAVIDAGNMHRFLALHGGLSPDILTIDDIRELDRKKEPPHKCAICDILWSDPLEDETGNGLDSETMEEWYAVNFEPNPTRGCGYVFGYKATIDFLERNQVTSLIRAHDVKREGYCEHHMHCKTGRRFPLVVTIFSAPNYCGYYENQAARLRLLPAKRKYGESTPRATNEMPSLLEDDDAENIANLESDLKYFDVDETPNRLSDSGKVIDFAQSMSKYTAKRQASLETVMKLAIPSLNLTAVDMPRSLIEETDGGISNIGTPVSSSSETNDSIDMTDGEVVSSRRSSAISSERQPEEVYVSDDDTEEAEPEVINPDYFPRLLFLTYAWVPSPFWLPSFENAIQYSLSYVTDRVTQVVNSILSLDVDDTEDEFYEKIEKRMSLPKVDDVAQLLCPLPTPQAQQGVVPLTYRSKIEKGTVRNKIKDLEVKRNFILCSADSPAVNRRKSLTLLNGAFQKKFSNYIAAAQNRFDKIKDQDRVNELRPPV